jgi:hypothetical protein
MVGIQRGGVRLLAASTDLILRSIAKRCVSKDGRRADEKNSLGKIDGEIGKDENKRKEAA